MACDWTFRVSFGVICLALACLTSQGQSLPFSESSVFLLDTSTSRLDSDEDGIPDTYELAAGLKPSENDSGEDPDGDQLTNLQEYNAGTSPFSPDPKQLASAESALFSVVTKAPVQDSDGDSLPDSWETEHGLSLVVDDRLEDPDGDSLNNLQEYNGGTNPRSSDTWDASSAESGLFAVNTSAYSYPVMTDSDGDGIPNWWEEKYGLNPALGDALADLDSDGSHNLAEFLAGSDPTRDETRVETVGLSALFTLDSVNAPVDGDNDGMRDEWEIANGLDSSKPDAEADSDLDGRSNLQEYNAGTNPLVDDWRGPSVTVSALFDVNTGGLNVIADTDSDGMPDWWEEKYGFKPLVPDAESDGDNDGRNNLDEYNAGSVPNVYDNPEPVVSLSRIFLVDTGGRSFDTDEDGLPDWWEKLYFNDPRGAEKSNDPDHDGVPNSSEYSVGSDPLDPESLFEIVGLQIATPPAASEIRIQWKSFEGGLYSLWGAYSPAGPYHVILTNISATPPTNEIREVLPAPLNYFRLRQDDRIEAR
jgi:hypothetical protein